MAHARFYYPVSNDRPPLAVGRAHLDPEQTHHARRVLRLAEGQAVELFDGRDAVAHGVIASYHASEAEVDVTSVTRVEPMRPRLTLATAIPKGPRADDMINQLSQLGADEVLPLRTVRGVREPAGGKAKRWERIAIESAKQCGRARLMAIGETVELHDALARASDLKIIASLSPGLVALGRAHWDRITTAEKVTVLVGPEGGWTPEEETQARDAGALAVSLGPYVLRIETAAAAAVALVRAAGRFAC